MQQRSKDVHFFPLQKRESTLCLPVCCFDTSGERAVHARPGQGRAVDVQSPPIPLEFGRQRSRVWLAPQTFPEAFTSSRPRQTGNIPARASSNVRNVGKATASHLRGTTFRLQRRPTNQAARWSRAHPHPPCRARAPLPTGLNNHIEEGKKGERPWLRPRQALGVHSAKIPRPLVPGFTPRRASGPCQWNMPNSISLHSVT